MLKLQPRSAVSLEIGGGAGSSALLGQRELKVAHEPDSLLKTRSGLGCSSYGRRLKHPRQLLLRVKSRAAGRNRHKLAAHSWANVTWRHD